MKWLHKIDLYPERITFNISNENSYKNKLGGYLSIIFVLIFLLFSTLMIIDFLQVRNIPNVLNITQKLEDNRKINFAENDFKLILNFEYYKDGKPKNETLKMNASSSNPSLKFKFEEIKIGKIRCEILFHDMTIDKSYKNNIINIMLNQNLTEREFIVFQANYSDIYLNFDDKNKPLVQTFNNKFFSADMDYGKVIYFEIGSTTVLTDTSMIYDIKDSVKSIFMYDFFDFDGPRYNEEIFRIYLKASSTNILYYRMYKKLIDVLPKINAIFSILFTFFKFLSSYLKAYTLNVKLLNRIFDFNKSKEKIKRLRKNTDEIFGTSQTDNNSINGEGSKKNIKLITIPKCPDDKKEKINKNLDRQNLGFKVVISFATNNCCFFRMSKKKILNFKNSLIIKNKLLNIDNYLLKLIEFEFLKTLVLDEDQLNLFKFLKIPSVRKYEKLPEDDVSYLIQNYDRYSITKRLHLLGKEVIGELHSSISNIKSKNDISRVDSKLLKNIKVSH